jgi:hypothetical protein
VSVAAGPVSADGARAARGEIVPLEQMRTLEVTAYSWDGGPYECDIEKHDGAVGFEEYDELLVADCFYGLGKASQQSTIDVTFLSADGYAYAHGCPGGGVFADGSGDSVFEVVFGSSTTQWCTLSGRISTQFAESFGDSSAEVVLTGPDEAVLFEVRLGDESGEIAFDEEILLAEGGPYTLRASSHAITEFEAIQNEYSVLLELAGDLPANDVGVLAINHPPAEVPAGDCAINLTVANYGSEDQEVPIHAEVLGPGAVFLDESFDGSFPPEGWSQEQNGEWQLHEGNEAGGPAPEAWLDRDNISGDYAVLDSAPVDTTGASRLVLEFKQRLNPSGALCTVYSRSSFGDPWTDITPWPNPSNILIGPETRRIEITHDIGPLTQVRWEYEDPDLGPRDYGLWHLNDVKIYALASVYESDESVSVSALSTADVEFTPPWEAPEGLYVLDASTELSGDEHPDNDGHSLMLTVEPVTRYEEQKLLRQFGETNDDFGGAVAIEGEWALIGATGVDAPFSSTGAVFVHRFNGSEWSHDDTLLASDKAEYDRFGCCVAISGDSALIGAWFDDNENGDDAGAAYVFCFDGSNWHEVTKLIASDGAEDDRLGVSVDLDGDLAVVGAHNDDDSGEDSGSAYIFRFDGANWVEETKLLASDGSSGDWFGSELALDGDVAVVSAPGADDLGEWTGAVYVYRYQRGDWVEEARLLASDGAAEDRFGSALALEGDRLVVGAFADDDLGRDCGAVYIFQHEGSTWIESAKLVPSDAQVADYFGCSVALEGSRIVVGAPAYSFFEGGAAYLFNYRDGSWEQTTRLLSSDLEDDDELGGAVAISDGTIFIGAPGDENDTGAAYVFAAPIAGDIDGDGDVDTADLLALLAAWGPCGDCPEDIDGNGTVNTADLLILLANWG